MLIIAADCTAAVVEWSHTEQSCRLDGFREAETRMTACFFSRIIVFSRHFSHQKTQHGVDFWSISSRRFSALET